MSPEGLCFHIKACQWVAEFVECDNHRNRHSCIKFVTPVQQHSGLAMAIDKNQADFYENVPRSESKAPEQICPLLVDGSSGVDK